MLCRALGVFTFLLVMFIYTFAFFSVGCLIFIYMAYLAYTVVVMNTRIVYFRRVSYRFRDDF